jgi:hypothetical protein
VADGGELKTGEWPEVGQILPTEVDVVQRIDGEQRGADRGGADEDDAR